MACPSTQDYNMNRYLVSRHRLCLYNSEFLLQNLIGMLNKMLDLFCLLLMYLYIRHVNGYIASYAAHLNFKNAPGTKILIINLTHDKTCDFTFAPVRLVYRTVNSFIWRSVWLSATGFRFNSKLTPDFLPYVTFNWKKTFFCIYFFTHYKTCNYIVIDLFSD